MTDYAAPLPEMRFVLDAVAGLDEIADLPGGEAVSTDLVDAVLEEAAKLAGAVLAPLNVSGDREGSRLENGVVRTPEGFRAAYGRYVEGGWNALAFAPEHGGQGLPMVLATAVLEMWNSANMSFALCPILTIGAVELLAAHGSAEQQRRYLPKLVSGEWTGTMNLTEPQAGSDLGALKTRAERAGDHYRITGQKIFITYGDHDLAPNIIHMVLARLPDAPPGSRGISLFLVPKFLVNPDGSLGGRNDLRCVSLEHKLGIHGSPTCVMAYGDVEGAVGYLVGEENRGLECMFTMMNNARLNVGVEGIAIAERAYQQARAYARERIQGKPLGTRGDRPRPILYHPDIRRMLLHMRAETEAARALGYYAAAAIDRSRRHPDPDERRRQQQRVDLMIPVVKAWCTDAAVEVASLGIQIHGGTGFIEETGAAQHYRDARILPIYEGTNGIQANDLVGRKLARDEGAAARALIAEMRDIERPLAAAADGLAPIGRALAEALDALDAATAWLVAAWREDAARASGGAVPYLKLLGTTTAGWLLARGVLAAAQRHSAVEDRGFLDAKRTTACFFAEQLMPQATALLPAIRGGGTILSLDPELL